MANRHKPDWMMGYSSDTDSIIMIDNEIPENCQKCNKMLFRGDKRFKHKGKWLCESCMHLAMQRR